jgi:hypothetical protein
MAPNLLFSLAPVVVLLNDSYVMTTMSYCSRPCPPPSFLAQLYFRVLKARAVSPSFPRLSLVCLATSYIHTSWGGGVRGKRKGKRPLANVKALLVTWG